MSDTHMKGLVGTNPLGFLAAVGIQVAFESEREQPRIWWSSDDVVPHAVADGNFTTTNIIKVTRDKLSSWKNGPVFNPDSRCSEENPLTLKFHPDGIREYLSGSREDPAAALATALVTEGGLAEKGIAKPSHLYFAAGNQKFLGMASKIITQASEDEILAALNGPWKYECECPTLGWDVVDDSDYALSARDPTKVEKYTNPGAEALAILGLSRYPVFVHNGKTVTQGCSRSWKSGSFSWPLWNKPSSFAMVKSLLAHAYEPPPTNRPAQDRTRWYRSWGVFRVLRSPMRRTEQGGYGTFGPHEVIWNA